MTSKAPTAPKATRKAATYASELSKAENALKKSATLTGDERIAKDMRIMAIEVAELRLTAEKAELQSA